MARVKAALQDGLKDLCFCSLASVCHVCTVRAIRCYQESQGVFFGSSGAQLHICLNCPLSRILINLCFSQSGICHMCSKLAMDQRRLDKESLGWSSSSEVKAALHNLAYAHHMCSHSAMHQTVKAKDLVLLSFSRHNRIFAHVVHSQLATQ